MKLIYQRLPASVLRLASTAREDPIGAMHRQMQIAIAHMRTGALPEQWVWDALEVAPQMIGMFSKAELIREPLVSAIERSAVTSFFALTYAWGNDRVYATLAERVEDVLLDDGELLGIYLDWAKKAGCRLTRPDAVYRRALVRDPVFGFKYATATGDDLFCDDLLSWAQRTSNSNSAAAWVTAVATSGDPEQWRAVIALNPFYAIVSSVTLGMRYSLSDFSPNQLDGRWLYHFLVNDACFDAAEFENALFALDPLWSVEWLIHEERTSQKGDWYDQIRVGLERFEKENPPLKPALFACLLAICDSLRRDAPEPPTSDSDEDGEDDEAGEAA